MQQFLTLLLKFIQLANNSKKFQDYHSDFFLQMYTFYSTQPAVLKNLKNRYDTQA